MIRSRSSRCPAPVRVAVVWLAAAMVGWPAAVFAQPADRQAPPEKDSKVAQRGPAAAAATPQTFLQINRDTSGRGALAVTAGNPITLSLNMPGEESWETANIGQFQIRTYGRQEVVNPEPIGGSGQVQYTFAEPGWALIIFCAGPAQEKGKSDSWQRTPYCTKLIVRVDPAEGARPGTFRTLRDPGLTAKVGMKVELLPYLSPPFLTFSSDPNEETYLPVRVYWEGAAEKQVTVRAYGPGGAKKQATTDAQGVANIKITGPGRWLIRYQKQVEGTTYTGDLAFEIPALAPGKGGGR